MLCPYHMIELKRAVVRDSRGKETIFLRCPHRIDNRFLIPGSDEIRTRFIVGGGFCGGVVEQALFEHPNVQGEHCVVTLLWHNEFIAAGFMHTGEVIVRQRELPLQYGTSE